MPKWNGVESHKVEALLGWATEAMLTEKIETKEEPCDGERRA
jgi:hypothetical protein